MNSTRAASLKELIGIQESMVLYFTRPFRWTLGDAFLKLELSFELWCALILRYHHLVCIANMFSGKLV